MFFFGKLFQKMFGICHSDRGGGGGVTEPVFVELVEPDTFDAIDGSTFCVAFDVDV